MASQPPPARGWPVPRPSFAAALGVVGGTALGPLLHAAGLPESAAWAAAIGGALLLVVARGRGWARLAAWVLAFAAAGGAAELRLLEREAADRSAYAVIVDAAEHLAVVEGVLASRPQESGVGLRLELMPGAVVGAGGRTVVLGTPLVAGLSADAADDVRGAGLEAGDRVRVAGRVSELTHDRDARAPDRWMRARGAVLSMRGERVEVLSAPEGRGTAGRLRAAATALAHRVSAEIHEHLPEREAALLAGLVLGETRDMSAEHREAYRRSGLYHLYSVSGFHAMLVGALTLALLRRTGMAPWPRLVAFALALLFFAALVGFGAPVLRAALILLAAALGDCLHRGVDSLAALATIFTGMVLATPGIIHHLDFQLTFLAALVLVQSGPVAVRLEERYGRVVGWGWPGSAMVAMARIALASAMIQLALVPHNAEWFGSTSVVAPLANAVLLPLFSLVVGLGFLGCMVLAVTGPVAGPLLGLLEWPLAALDAANGLFARPEWAMVALQPMSAPAQVAWYALVFATPWVLRRRDADVPAWRRWWVAVVAIIVLATAPPDGEAVARHVFRVRVLDVGQGDAILVESRDGRRVLVDAGRDTAAARWLEALGVRELDAIVATHADADHIGGMAMVLERVRVGRLLTGGSIAATGTFDALADVVARRGIQVVQVGRGATIRFGTPTVTLEVLHPTAAFLAEGDATNDASVVAHVAAEGTAGILLTGDAESAAEADMMAAKVVAPTAILKAGHHGAATSSGAAFIARVAPGLGIMSCGAGNPFGHPAAETLRRFEAAGVAVWRTDRDGTITLDFRRGGRVEARGTRREGRLMIEVPGPAGP